MRQACGFSGAEIARRARSFPFLSPVLFVTSGVILALPAPARAMHLSDGVLPMGWAALWAAAPFVAVALARSGLERTGLAAGFTGCWRSADVVAFSRFSSG